MTPHKKLLYIVYVPVSSLKPNPYNPNVHDARSFDLLLSSLRTFGFTQPIVVDEGSMEIIDGENRWRCACILGMVDVPVCFLSLTDEQRRAATIIHNRARGREQKAQIAAIEGALPEYIRNDVLLADR